jgi:ferric-dicitrate binding protein FerR (iron transport regulator)
MFKKYAQYTVEDFVKDEQFIEWAKYGRSDEESIWLDITKDSPRQAEMIANARQIVLQLSEVHKANVDELEVASIWEGIENALPNENKPVSKPLWFSRVLFPVAASVLFILGIGWWQYQRTTSAQNGLYTKLIEEVKLPVSEIVNTTGQPMTVNLSDGSKVILEKDSRLSYVNNFDGPSRDVFLSGAAFFNVTKNPRKPFIVYANEVVTKVLGTSFSVNAFEENKQVVVSVKTGKVSVSTNGSAVSVSKNLTLIPNQRAIFFREKEKLIRALVEQPQVVITQEELMQFTFTNAPVSSIFEALQKAYGVEIQFDKALLSGCHLTTSLSNETLFERLDVICEAIEATYEVVDGQVVVSGQKCN